MTSDDIGRVDAMLDKSVGDAPSFLDGPADREHTEIASGIALHYEASATRLPVVGVVEAGNERRFPLDLSLASLDVWVVA